MPRGGPRKAGGGSRQGAKAAVTILTADSIDESMIPPMPDPEKWIPVPGTGGQTRSKEDEMSMALHGAKDPDPDEYVAEWAPAVVDWWNDIWTSPMASEFVDSDIHGLYMACYYMHESLNPFYRLSDRLAASKMFEQTVKNYGLTPSARETLRWQVAQGTAAQTRTNNLRKAASSGQMKKEPGGDQDLYSRHG